MSLLPGFLVLLAVFTVGDAFREARDEEFPFQVSIQTTDKRHLCGGTIIAPFWVLTAHSCLRSHAMVHVVYGSVDSNDQLNVVLSENIVLQPSYGTHTKNLLALIRVQRRFEFSKTAKQASLPIKGTQIRNTTKLSGWKTEMDVNVPPSLYVSDRYLVITENCKTPTGLSVPLSEDEFCGIDEDGRNLLFNPGAVVSKNAIAVGILTDPPQFGVLPHIYVKLSEHEQWIKDVLGSDAEFVNWVDKIPKDSAPSHCAISLALMGISAILLRLV